MEGAGVERRAGPKGRGICTKTSDFGIDVQSAALLPKPRGLAANSVLQNAKPDLVQLPRPPEFAAVDMAVCVGRMSQFLKSLISL
jgi:hypothetical protein